MEDLMALADVAMYENKRRKQMAFRLPIDTDHTTMAVA
jgi:hypothetical protein